MDQLLVGAGLMRAYTRIGMRKTSNEELSQVGTEPCHAAAYVMAAWAGWLVNALGAM